MPFFVPSSTYSTQNKVLNFISAASDKLNKQYTKIGSGKSAQHWSDLPAYEARAVQELEGQAIYYRSQLKIYDAQNRKMEAVGEHMQHFHKNMTKMAENIMRANNPVMGKEIPLRMMAQQTLADIQIILGTSFDGDYLFSGNKLTTIPISDITYTSNIGLNGQPTNSYYRGDYPDDAITAGDEMFQKAIAAMHLLVTGVAEDRNQALDWVQDAIAQSSDAVTTLGFASAGLKQQHVQTENMLLFVEGEMGKILALDLPTAVMELERQRNILDATFVATSKIQNMSLAQYLR
ncbi:MAG: hypothetical protein JSS50_03190 [Proteobacteria bacterium]|nr:hypothetical protein [Pseudomonadota bacterium]